MPFFPLRILLLNFPEHVGQALRYYVQDLGWAIEETFTRPGYLRKVQTNDYALILMDASALKRDSLQYCSAIKRAIREKSIFLFITEGGMFERILGFQAGADDCISKPFSIRELLYRMKVLLRSFVIPSGPSIDKTFRNPLLNTTLVLDEHRPFICLKHSPVQLSHREYSVLAYLASHANQIISREELLQTVWKSKKIGYYRTVDTNIKRIREKLKQINPDLAGLIRTERGRGYCLLDPTAVTG